jgi:hypothetical protein
LVISAPELSEKIVGWKCYLTFACVLRLASVTLILINLNTLGEHMGDKSPKDKSKKQKQTDTSKARPKGPVVVEAVVPAGKKAAPAK